MPKDVTQDVLTSTIDAAIDRQQVELNKFKERLEQNPSYAFSWGTSALAASAALDVLQEAKHYLDSDPQEGSGPITFEAKLERMREYFTRNMLNAATHVEASTSPLSNLVGEYKRVALAKLVQTLNGDYFGGF